MADAQTATEDDFERLEKTVMPLVFPWQFRGALQLRYTPCFSVRCIVKRRNSFVEAFIRSVIYWGAGVTIAEAFRTMCMLRQLREMGLKGMGFKQ